MYCNEEKENFQGFRNLQGSFMPMVKADGLPAATKPRGGAFGKLLDSAQADFKRAQVEQDEKYASKSLIDDACAVTNDWIQESQDKMIAQELHERMAADDKQTKMKEEKEGESAALRIAMDERNKVRSEQQAKAAKEVEDRNFAKKMVLADIDAETEFKALCDNDGNVAKEVYNQIQDELYAERIHEEELNEMAIYRQKQLEMEEADAKFAKLQQEQMEKEAEELRKINEQTDAEYARVQQKLSDQREQAKKVKQSAEDAKVARKMQVQSLREEHRRLAREKYMKLRHNRVLGASITAETIEGIARRWEEAEANIEDVADGICITIELPYLNKLSVRATDCRTVEIEATRVFFSNHNGKVRHEFNGVDYTNYSADFIIEGDGVNLDDTCLSYEYLSDTGLLHVYVDSVSLAAAQNDIKQGVLDGLKSSFKRLFSK